MPVDLPKRKDYRKFWLEIANDFCWFTFGAIFTLAVLMCMGLKY